MSLSPQLATALGRVLLKTAGDAVPLLSAAQARCPQDFWLNFELGWALFESAAERRSPWLLPRGAGAAARGQPGLSPSAAILDRMGRLDEAIRYFAASPQARPQPDLRPTSTSRWP